MEFKSQIHLNSTTQSHTDHHEFDSAKLKIALMLAEKQKKDDNDTCLNGSSAKRIRDCAFW